MAAGSAGARGDAAAPSPEAAKSILKVPRGQDKSDMTTKLKEKDPKVFFYILWIAKSNPQHFRDPGSSDSTPQRKYQQTMVSHGFRVQDFVHPRSALFPGQDL